MYTYFKMENLKLSVKLLDPRRNSLLETMSFDSKCNELTTITHYPLNLKGMNRYENMAFKYSSSGKNYLSWRLLINV